MAEFQQPESSWADNHGQRSEGTPKRGEQWSGALLCWLIMGSCSEEEAILYHHKVSVSKPERWRESVFGFWVKGLEREWIQMDRDVEGVNDFPVSVWTINVPILNLCCVIGKNEKDNSYLFIVWFICFLKCGLPQCKNKLFLLQLVFLQVQFRCVCVLSD